MSSYRHSLVEILAEYGDKPHDPDDRGLIERVASALYERYEDLPEIDQWPESVRDFYALYDIEFQLGNGGFAQAAFNVPELLPIAEDAYRRLGRPQAADLLHRAIEMLPEEFRLYMEKGLDEYPDLDDVFEHFNESPMEALDEELDGDDFGVDEDLQRLVKANRAEFESMETPT